MYAAVQAMFVEMSFAEDFPGAARLGIVILSFNLYHDFFFSKIMYQGTSKRALYIVILDKEANFVSH